jgi:serine-aspartate repeat-containing protein C/D/E
LGDADDQPVVGDWDGDGKDDIGIYGPIWEHDYEAIAREPGLPNPENSVYTKPKNVPPVDTEATSGARTMKLTSFGRQRADVVDHVFGIGEGDEIAVTGDWNGNGIRSIGKFRGGVWHLDVNGDGRFNHEDAIATFGRAGDQPVVGDFNGDGIEEIAVYRSGTWMIDTNGNRELDATDKTFEMGGTLDKPVVGDWDGDGIDEPGLYTEQSNNTVFE